jgi:hypothetical protein
MSTTAEAVPGADLTRCRGSSRSLRSGNVMTDAYVTVGRKASSRASRRKEEA